MKMFKKLASLLVLLFVFLLFFSCNKTENNGETSSSATTAKENVSVTEKEKRIPTVKEVAEANLLENLLKRNKCVYFKTESDYETTTEAYFSFNSEIVRAVDQTLHNYYEEGEDINFVTGEYKGESILSVNKERFCVRAFVDLFGEESENENTLWYNDIIAYPLINDNLSLKEETDEFYIYENLNDNPDDELYVQRVCYVDKNNLNIMKVVHVNDDIVVEKEYVYNEPVELMNILDDWDGKMKKVTVVSETDKDGKTVKHTKRYEVPYNWEVIADNNLYDTVFSAYLDEGYTKEYEYPGDGVDYTIYATTSVG
ncbi:MAG: hypothetical protein IJ279_07470 [Clostridia bacterium]|nr:hypothetical protein [Clostridia bacterium]